MKPVIKNILKSYRFRPKKFLGQNFLIDKSVFKKIIKSSNLQKNDLVIEVGPGLGFLTNLLLKYVKKVIAVEKDKELADFLQIRFKGSKNLKIIKEDILKLQLNSLIGSSRFYKVISNIPFYITSPLIRFFLESQPSPKLMVLMVQKEIAQRICAEPPNMSLLSVSVQFYGRPQIVAFVSKKAFWPSPKVDAAILKISQIQQPSKFLIEKFFRIVRAGFANPRKQLINNLSSNLNLEKEYVAQCLKSVKINPQTRAETLSVLDWKKLSSKIKMRH